MPDLDHADHFPYGPQDAGKLSTEELERLIREDFESDDMDPDPNKEAFLLRAVEVIDEREKDDPDAPHFRVNGRPKKHKWRFALTYEEPTYYCSEETIAELTAMLEEYKQKYEAGELNPPQPEIERADHRTPRKKILILAAVVAVIGGCFFAVNGDNLFNLHGNSTPDTFQFQPETGTSQNITQTGTYLDDDQTLHDLLAEQGITEPVSPKWIPEGYSLSKLQPYPELIEPIFTALYEDEDGSNAIIEQITVRRNVQAILAENDDVNYTVYNAGGIAHHVIQNDDTLTVTWFNENLECSLSGNISEEEMEAMINSIYEE